FNNDVTIYPGASRPFSDTGLGRGPHLLDHRGGSGDAQGVGPPEKRWSPAQCRDRWRWQNPFADQGESTTLPDDTPQSLFPRHAPVANGTMRVVSGVFNQQFEHTRDPDSDHHIRCYPDESQATLVELPAGGVLFFCYGTPHATGANTTDHERAGVALHFINAD